MVFEYLRERLSASWIFTFEAKLVGTDWGIILSKRFDSTRGIPLEECSTWNTLRWRTKLRFGRGYIPVSGICCHGPSRRTCSNLSREAVSAAFGHIENVRSRTVNERKVGKLVTSS